MDFIELEAMEGLRWPWNSWPVTKSEANALVIPLSIMCTPLMHITDLPVLPYDPLICNQCAAVLNPYARVDYPTRIWVCPFCYQKNGFPRSYTAIGEDNIPAELFPTYSTVEYNLVNKNKAHWGNSYNGVEYNLGTKTGSFGSLSGSFSGASLSGLETRGGGIGPAFVFVLDGCLVEEELQGVKNELLLVISQLPENALVGLLVFDAMVRVYDLGFTDCLRVVLFNGERQVSSSEVHFWIRLLILYCCCFLFI